MNAHQTIPDVTGYSIKDEGSSTPRQSHAGNKEPVSSAIPEYYDPDDEKWASRRCC